MKRYNDIIVFGDGLNDMGSWGKLTNNLYPPAHHGFYEGRWTNGKVWVEIVAEKLGLSLSLANNFAMGGATTGIFNINEPLKGALNLTEEIPVIGMLAQVHLALNSRKEISENTLIVLWAGGHDIGSYLDFGQPDVKAYPPAVNYLECINLLVNHGAKHFIIGTMPDMGKSPIYQNSDKEAMASQLCRELNEGLDEIINNQKFQNIEFIKVDGNRIFAEVGANPLKYGFKHYEPYLPFDIIDFANPLRLTNLEVSNSIEGLDPDEFMNWWAVSASAKMHQIIANDLLSILNTQKG